MPQLGTLYRKKKKKGKREEEKRQDSTTATTSSSMDSTPADTTYTPPHTHTHTHTHAHAHTHRASQMAIYRKGGGSIDLASRGKI